MFKHSVKVPRLYKTAAKVAKSFKEGEGSIKKLVYENRSKHPNIKAIYALVATLFQRDDELESLLKKSQLLVNEPRSDPWLTKILIVELLWGKKSLPGNSKPEKTVLAYEQIFKAHISDTPSKTENDLNSKEEFKPRYVRVNTLNISSNEAIDRFRDEGWVLSKFFNKADYKGFLDKISSLTDEEFMVDIHIPDLLIFPPKTQFYNHPAYKNGSIILQDKASCLSVQILGPAPGSTVLDMCAAPGMKTTHLAAAMNNEGKIYAVERDSRRFEILNKLIQSSGATCVITVNKDVLTCSGDEFSGVEYILVDPSCSGSGMTDRLRTGQSKSNERIEKLAGFQIKILRSALTKYPKAKRVVYSTCSIFPEENEDVVRQVIETNTNFKLVPAITFVNNTWKNFGALEYGKIGSHCLYAKPDEDFTNGFFVAVFERLGEGEENEFFNTKIYNFKKHVQSQEKWKMKQQERYSHIRNNIKSEYLDDVEDANDGPGDNNFNHKGKQKTNLVDRSSFNEVASDSNQNLENHDSENIVRLVDSGTIENAKSKKRNKKKNADVSDENSKLNFEENCNRIEETPDVSPKTKKHKKKRVSANTSANTEMLMSTNNIDEDIKQHLYNDDNNLEEDFNSEQKIKKRKKKKRDYASENRSEESEKLMNADHTDEDIKHIDNYSNTLEEEFVTKHKKKKKKNISVNEDDGFNDLQVTNDNVDKKGKKRKSDTKDEFSETVTTELNDKSVSSDSNKRKKKKKSKDVC